MERSPEEQSSWDAWESKTGEQQRRNKKGERDVQVCDADQSLGDTEGGKGREGGKAHTDGVRPVKRKGQWSKKRWRDGRGNNMEGKRERYGQSHKACVSVAALLFCALSLRECFSFMISFLFLLGRCMHTPTQTVTTFHASFTTARQGKHHSHKRCGHTAPHSSALLSSPHSKNVNWCCRCHTAFLHYLICFGLPS